jgi:hypothetical protein
MAARGKSQICGGENNGAGCIKGECAYKTKKWTKKMGRRKIKLCNSRIKSIFIKVCLQGAVNNETVGERRTAIVYCFFSFEFLLRYEFKSS